MEKEKAENLTSNKESLEKLEERDRVIALLHDFYQEQQKNMPVHREIAELAEKIKSFFEKANVYRDRFFETKSYVKENDWNSKNQRNEYSIHSSDKNDTQDYWQDPIEDIVPKLQRILNKAELKEPEKEELTFLIQNLEKAVSEINEKVGKLWQIKENIAKQFLSLPEFSEWNGGVIEKSELTQGLYNLDGEINVEKIFETEEGKQKENIWFEPNDRDVKKGIESLNKKYNITKEELEKIKNLEWSAEDKEKLKNLMEDVSEYRAEAVKLKEGLLKSANFKFKNEGADLVKDEFMRAFIRQLYEDYKLPIIHKERVVQEIMNGTFSF